MCLWPVSFKPVSVALLFSFLILMRLINAPALSRHVSILTLASTCSVGQESIFWKYALHENWYSLRSVIL